MANARPPIERPLSPHLSIYKMKTTMLMSGLHRITGLFLYFGTVLLVGWLLALASGPDAFAWASWFFGSILGRLILFGYTFTLLHHMAGGVRHLIWDTGAGLEPGTRERLSGLTLVASLALTAIVWLAVLLR